MAEHSPNKHRKSGFLPLMGLLLAVSIGVAAFFAAPLIDTTLQENISSYLENVGDVPETTRHIMIGVLIWFIAFSISILFVSSIAGGDSLVEQEGKVIHPRGRKLTEKQIKKIEKKQAQQRREKIKALKRLKAKKEAEAKKRK